MFTDHSTIKYIMNKPIVNGRIIRWLLLVQDFNVTIIEKLGKANVVEDFLSQIKKDNGDCAPMQDEFLDENLFSISIKTPWFIDIANYLATSKFPPKFTSKQKNHIVQESAMFKWINEMLF